MFYTKLGNAIATGSLTIIVVWFARLGGLEVPPEVASAFTLFVSGLFGATVPTKERAADNGVADSGDY